MFVDFWLLCQYTNTNQGKLVNFGYAAGRRSIHVEIGYRGMMIDMMGWIMVIILMMLFFVMMFGIGFILNMLMKTTWFPIGFYIVIVLPATIWMLWKSEMSFIGNIGSYGLVDYLTALAGLAGAFVSGKTIDVLRKSGYKMF